MWCSRSQSQIVNAFSILVLPVGIVSLTDGWVHSLIVRGVDVLVCMEHQASLLQEHYKTV